MADGDRMTRDASEKTSRVDEINGIKTSFFDQGMQNSSLLECQRRRGPKRSYLDFGITTLSAREDTESKLKKRQRKADKRFVVDKVDGFTFISALMLNDFDEYEKNPVKHPLAPTKRKSAKQIETGTVKRKPIQPTVEKSKAVSSKVKSDFIPIKEFSCTSKSVSKTVWDKCKKKGESPLSKSALVRLKQINVTGLNKNNTLDSRNCTPDVSKIDKNNYIGKVKKSFGLKVPLLKIKCADRPKFVPKKPKIPLTQVDICGADSFNKFNETASPGLTDSEDSLDICGIDESSPSQYVFNRLNLSEKKDRTSTKPNNEESNKAKKKPCRVCCLYPCRIVGAKRLKSRVNKFPSFDISFVSRCQVHTSGEIVVGDPYKGKVDVNIQTTWTDIKMHVDFVKRFPYRAISIASCQPSLDNGDSKLLNGISVVTQRCSESHRLLEQKRREELHSYYCKLSDTLLISPSISGNRTSKQAILDTAIQEIKSLHEKDEFLTQELNEVALENVRKEKRWEELAGKAYPKPDESPAKKESKSKLLELYQKYMSECNLIKKDADNETKVNSKNQGNGKNARKEEGSKEKKDVRGYAENICNVTFCQANNSTLAGTESGKKSDITVSFDQTSLQMAKKTPVSACPVNASATSCEQQIRIGSSQAVSVKKESSTRQFIQSSLLRAVNDTPVTASPVSASVTNQLQQIPVRSSQAASVAKETFVSQSVQPSSLKSVNHAQVNASQVTLLTNSRQSIPIGSSRTQATCASSRLHHIVDILQNKPVSMRVSRTSCIPKIDLTNESQELTATTEQPKTEKNQTEVVKSNPLTQLNQLVRSPLLIHPTSNPSSALPNVATQSSLSPAMVGQSVQKEKSTSGLEYIIINMIVQGETTVYRIPKTVEGFGLLQKLAEKFPSDQTRQSGVTTTNLATTTGQTHTTSLMTYPPGTSTQWSAASSIQNPPLTSIQKSPIPNSSVNSNVTSKSAQQADAAAKDNVVRNVASASKSVRQVTEVSTSLQVGSAAKSWQPSKFEDNNSKCKQPMVATPVSSVANTRQLPVIHRRSKDVITLNKFKQSNAIKAPAAESPKLLLLDSPNLRKSDLCKFTVIPTSSSINVTLNKLGSITGNKVFNKGPVPNQTRKNLPYPIAVPRPTAKYHTSPKPEPIIIHDAAWCASKPSARLQNSTTSSTRIPMDELFTELSEIPPDIPSHLTDASLAPLETIPEISDSLLESSSQKDTEDMSGFCVISNVFSLSDTATAVTNIDN